MQAAVLELETLVQQLILRVKNLESKTEKKEQEPAAPVDDEHDYKEGDKVSVRVCAKVGKRPEEWAYGVVDSVTRCFVFVLLDEAGADGKKEKLKRKWTNVSRRA